MTTFFSAPLKSRDMWFDMSMLWGGESWGRIIIVVFVLHVANEEAMAVSPIDGSQKSEFSGIATVPLFPNPNITPFNFGGGFGGGGFVTLDWTPAGWPHSPTVICGDSRIMLINPSPAPSPLPSYPNRNSSFIRNWMNTQTGTNTIFSYSARKVSKWNSTAGSYVFDSSFDSQMLDSTAGYWNSSYCPNSYLHSFEVLNNELLIVKYPFNIIGRFSALDGSSIGDFRPNLIQSINPPLSVGLFSTNYNYNRSYEMWAPDPNFVTSALSAPTFHIIRFIVKNNRLYVLYLESLYGKLAGFNTTLYSLHAAVYELGSGFNPNAVWHKSALLGWGYPVINSLLVDDSDINNPTFYFEGSINKPEFDPPLSTIGKIGSSGLKLASMNGMTVSALSSRTNLSDSILASYLGPATGISGSLSEIHFYQNKIFVLGHFFSSSNPGKDLQLLTLSADDLSQNSSFGNCVSGGLTGVCLQDLTPAFTSFDLRGIYFSSEGAVVVVEDTNAALPSAGWPYPAYASTNLSLVKLNSLGTSLDARYGVGGLLNFSPSASSLYSYTSDFFRTSDSLQFLTYTTDGTNAYLHPKEYYFSGLNPVLPPTVTAPNINRFVGDSVSWAPVISGAVESCSVGPTPPYAPVQGLSFDSTNCVALGGSTFVQATTNPVPYTIVASNAGGSSLPVSFTVIVNPKVLVSSGLFTITQTQRNCVAYSSIGAEYCGALDYIPTNLGTSTAPIFSIPQPSGNPIVLVGFQSPSGPQCLAGDINLDGIVNPATESDGYTTVGSADWRALQNFSCNLTLSCTWADGDFSGDGKVDLADANLTNLNSGLTGYSNCSFNSNTALKVSNPQTPSLTQDAFTNYPLNPTIFNGAISDDTFSGAESYIGRAVSISGNFAAAAGTNNVFFLKKTGGTWVFSSKTLQDLDEKDVITGQSKNFPIGNTKTIGTIIMTSQFLIVTVPDSPCPDSSFECSPNNPTGKSAMNGAVYLYNLDVNGLPTGSPIIFGQKDSRSNLASTTLTAIKYIDLTNISDLGFGASASFQQNEVSGGYNLLIASINGSSSGAFAALYTCASNCGVASSWSWQKNFGGSSSAEVQIYGAQAAIAGDRLVFSSVVDTTLYFYERGTSWKVGIGSKPIGTTELPTKIDGFAKVDLAYEEVNSLSYTGYRAAQSSGSGYYISVFDLPSTKGTLSGWIPGPPTRISLKGVKKPMNFSDDNRPYSTYASGLILSKNNLIVGASGFTDSLIFNPLGLTSGGAFVFKLGLNNLAATTYQGATALLGTSVQPCALLSTDPSSPTINNTKQAFMALGDSIAYDKNSGNLILGMPACGPKSWPDAGTTNNNQYNVGGVVISNLQ